VRQDFKGRPTADLIVIFLTGVVGLLLVGTGLVALSLELSSSEHSNEPLLTFTGDIVKGFVGIIIGYIAGRGVSNGRNGHEPARAPAPRPGEQADQPGADRA
jgi:hypothetical protein